MKESCLASNWALEHTIIGRNVFRPFVRIKCTHCLISSPKPSTMGMNAFITQFTYIYACPMACAVYDEKCVLRIFNVNTQNAQFKVCVCKLAAITTIRTRRGSAESPQLSTNEWDEPMRCKWLPKWNELHHKINMHTKKSSKTHARDITSKLLKVQNYLTSD